MTIIMRMNSGPDIPATALEAQYRSVSEIWLFSIIRLTPRARPMMSETPTRLEAPLMDCLGNGLLVKAAQEHADDGDSEERSGHLREPPALGHNAPNHDNECHDEEHQNDLALPVERRNVVRIGVMRSVELGELLAVFML